MDFNGFLASHAPSDFMPEAKRQSILLTHAACILMAGKPAMPRTEAVKEVLMTYQEICEAFAAVKEQNDDR